MKYTTAVIFDMDGTLLNTLCDLADATNYALEECGFPTRTDNEVRNFIGNGVEMLIRRAVPKDTPEDKIQECLGIFKIYYTHNSHNKTKPYDGIIELLTNLKRKGFKLGVVSNKFDRAVKKLCDEYFCGLIDIATGESETTPKKPDPTGVLKTIEELGAKPEQTVLVGDSDVDIETAKNAGISSVGVLWGYRDEKVLTDAGADELVDSPQKLEFIL